MKSKKYCLLILIFTIVLIVSGCTTNKKSAALKSMDSVSTGQTSQATVSESVAQNTLNNSKQATTTSKGSETTIKETSIKYEDLIDEEKVIYNEIKNATQNNEQYFIGFSKNSLQGMIKFDFNFDGKIDELKYYTKSDEINKTTKKIKIQINDTFIEEEYTSDDYGGISGLGIIDADKTDKFVDIVIIEGELSDRVQNIFYRFDGSKIAEIGSLAGSILAYSGDGKIYFWGGNLYEPSYYLEEFDKNLVMIYYDIKTNKKYTSNQIIGKTFIADRSIILYKTKKDVVSGAAVEEEDILNMYKDNIIRKIEIGEKFTVLDIDGIISKDEYDGNVNYFNNDDGVKIKMQNGEIGWIGGFHMVWD